MSNLTICAWVAVVLLTYGSAQAQVSEPSSAVPPPAKEKLRCRSQTATGSLVRKTRICMSDREWARQRERAQSMNTLTCSDSTVCAGS